MMILPQSIHLFAQNWLKSLIASLTFVTYFCYGAAAGTSQNEQFNRSNQANQANEVNQGGSQESPSLLRAQITKHEGMSRTELDNPQTALSPINPTDSQLINAAGQSRSPSLSGAAQNQTTMLSGSAQNQSFNLQSNQNFNLNAHLSPTNLESDASADIRAREYNVDWASWLSHFADRWFYVLTQYEKASHAQFVTERPALFQFTCYANGTLSNVVVKQSSGDVAYDRLQVIALMQAMPAPPFPAGTHRQSITLVQGWESHVRKPGENDFIPGSFGKGFPMEKVKEWVKAN